MHEPWEEGWKREPAAATGPGTGRKLFALLVLGLASAGFAFTVLWPLAVVFR